MSTATAEAVGTAAREIREPWMPAVAEVELDEFGEEPLPDGWEDELANDPEILAELDRRLAEAAAQKAAGTWVRRSTEEVFAELERKYPNLIWDSTASKNPSLRA